MTKDSSESFAVSSFPITVFAPAKINLVLRILDRRPDGFHNLWSLMQTVRLEDEVVIRINREHADIRLQCDVPSLSVDHTNLVYRAAEAVLRRCERRIGVEIVLAKRIPMGAGLGGGSSDAAATIVGLDRALNLGWSVVDMAQVGQALGSDVPFFFFSPSAVVTGRGEQVHPVQITGSRWVVLINPGFPVETKWAYQELSSSRTQVRPLLDIHAALGRESGISWEQALETAENDFEAPVFRAHPGLQEIKQAFMAQGAEAALLSGSGATVFGIFRNEGEARKAQAHFQTQPRLKVFAVVASSGPLIVKS
ncbi:MAG: 4-(cytidine 5'-diphospho)-2-C-methyl-D-erythritol kinase [Nitrospira sp.]|nr:4-(cytidine 5'-diphospho)-2-C-methyl-D-erythritol kinase [Nitrospira sp.]